MTTSTKKSSSTVSGGEPVEDSTNDRNTQLRRRYLELEARVEALDAADPTLDAVIREMNRIASDFIEHNNGLSAYVAHRWAKSQEDFQDLYQQGLTTMWEYFQTWDPSRATFSTYAMASLEGDVRRLNVKMTGNESYYDRLGRGKLVDALEKLTRELGRTPSNLEVAAETGMHPDRVERMRRKPVTSLDAPIDSEGTTRLDLLASSSFDINEIATDVEDRAYLANLAAATEQLHIRDVVLLLRRDGLDGWPPETLSQLGGHLGVGREVLRRAEAAARESIKVNGQRLPALY